MKASEIRINIHQFAAASLSDLPSRNVQQVLTKWTEAEARPSRISGQKKCGNRNGQKQKAKPAKSRKNSTARFFSPRIQSSQPRNCCGRHSAPEAFIGSFRLWLFFEDFVLRVHC